MTSTSGYGFQVPDDDGTLFDQITFMIRQMMNKLSVMKLVQVQAVHTNGALAAAGTVDVLPLVSQVDGNFNTTPHGVVYGLPWFRLQGGLNAVICDPQVNDFGYVTVSDRDISALKANRVTANYSQGSIQAVSPGTWRKYDLADGIYVGGCLNATPTQYLQFGGSGIVLTDLNGNSIVMSGSGIVFTTLKGDTITATSSGWAFSGNIIVTGNITATGTITAGQGGADQVGLQSHKHGGVSTGAATTLAPTAGT